MSLLFTESFDHYSVSQMGIKGWQDISTPDFTVGSGRRGGIAARWSSGGFGAKQVFMTPMSTIIVGVAYRQDILTPGSGFMFFGDSAATHIILACALDGSILVYRGNTATLIATSVPRVLTTSQFVFLEVKLTISDTVGAIVIRANGNPTPVLNVSGLDTRNVSTSFVSYLRIQCPSGLNVAWFDDMYVCDTLGADNNDFLGDCEVALLTVTGAGNYTQLTPNTAVANYTTVDEATPSQVDYNSSSTVGNRDTYAMSNLVPMTSSAIYGVQVCAAMNKDDAGSKSGAAVVRSGGVDGDGSAVALSTGLTYVTQVFERNPNGSIVWVDASVNAMEVGAKVAA